MTAYNNKIRYKIEVEDVDSHVIELPATITVNFTAGEIVNGDDSGASAVVVETTELTDTSIKVKNKDGFFYELEGLTGGSGGDAEKTGTTIRTSSPYTNANYNIDNGLWTLILDGENGELLTKIDNAVQKINISKGGNLASGYTFGFDIENFGFAEDIQSDGVYFKNRKCTLYVGLVDGVPSTVWSKEWSGIIDTFTDAKEGSLKFKCTDITKSNVETVGSKEVPICLNKNYNCKLTDQFETTTLYYVRESIWGYDIAATNVQSVVATSVSNKIVISFYTSGDYLANYETNFNDGYIEVVAGEDSGGVYKIYSAELGTFANGVYPLTITVLDDLSDIKSSENNAKEDVSLVRIFSKSQTFNLSQNTIARLHNEFESISEKPLTVTDDKRKIKLKRYSDYNLVSYTALRAQIQIGSLSNENEKKSDTKILLDERYNEQIYTFSNGANFESIYRYNISPTDLKTLEDSHETNGEIYFDIEQSLINGVIDSTPTFINVTGFEILIRGMYRSEVFPGGFSSMLEFSDKEVPIVTLSGNDLIVDYSDGLNNSLSSLPIQSFNKESVYSHVEVSVILRLEVVGANTSDTTTYDLVGAGVRAVNEFPLDNRSIGCDGENVDINNPEYTGYETVPDTITYLLENYYGKDSGDIDSASFDQAQEDFGLYVDDPARNAAHQIVEQNGGNSLLKEILFDHILGMFPARDGLYKLENWLPKSIIFGETSTLADFDDTNVLSDPKTGKPRISKITRDDINNVISDYEFEIDYNESTGEHDKTIRIKNTNEASFDFDRDTEGIDIEDSGLAEGAWIQGNSGNNRVDGQTQTKKSTKWIKLSNSDGTGTSEAVAFIRNILSHVNRQHEYITFSVPINTANLSLELLSFISILDPKITDNVTRKCWIVERKLNTKDDYIEFKVLLDIHPYDQYLQRANAWQDGDNVEIKEDGNNPLNIKQNGLGV